MGAPRLNYSITRSPTVCFLRWPWEQWIFNVSSIRRVSSPLSPLDPNLHFAWGMAAGVWRWSAAPQTVSVRTTSKGLQEVGPIWTRSEHSMNMRILYGSWTGHVIAAVSLLPTFYSTSWQTWTVSAIVLIFYDYCELDLLTASIILTRVYVVITFDQELEFIWVQYHGCCVTIFANWLHSPRTGRSEKYFFFQWASSIGFILCWLLIIGLF